MIKETFNDPIDVMGPGTVGTNCEDNDHLERVIDMILSIAAIPSIQTYLHLKTVEFNKKCRDL